MIFSRLVPGLRDSIRFRLRIRRPGTTEFSRQIDRKRNVLAALLSHALGLFNACQAGLVFGTDESCERFLPPAQWDRGVIDRLDGPGMAGTVYRIIGRAFIKQLNLSPIRLFERNALGELIPADGITAYALRHHKAFYDQGVKILLAEKAPGQLPDPSGGICAGNLFRVFTYDGQGFARLTDVRANVAIVDRFRAKNFMTAYIPDYGAVILNTVQGEDIVGPDGCFVYDAALTVRLDHLITAIEAASLVYLAKARGRAAMKLILRKETRLRQTAVRLVEKEAMLKEQEAHLLAVGGVSAAQLAMAPTAVYDGVFAFIDMAGSVSVSRKLPPRAYFFLLNLCHEIAAENARTFGCRVDNIIGDAVFFENLHLFDAGAAQGPEARLMRMTCLLAAILGNIRDLAHGRHPLDREQKARQLLRDHGLSLGFRAGMSLGNALVGPLGSCSRRIVTAIGEAVDQASRLESTGQINHIHVMAPVAGLLREAWVSKDTPVVFEFARRVLADRPGWKAQPDFSFFAFYRTWQGLDRKFVRKAQDPACYKEFSDTDTCLIPCFKEPGLAYACPGI